jgi:hypothetical protein
MTAAKPAQRPGIRVSQRELDRLNAAALAAGATRPDWVRQTLTAAIAAATRPPAAPSPEPTAPDGPPKRGRWPLAADHQRRFTLRPTVDPVALDAAAKAAGMVPATWARCVLLAAAETTRAPL